ncbi:hypothetical protein BAUCODRAFT_155205 [Baudoinia panamericana UAMH 10762]|uniref:Acyl-CoA thioesterase II n=1 Tax=Baudoinia panamericana (strain UAMH 10762) TaxID=717646 RepID=M2LTT6_BAUPA|nr:uncharacterized protein BAUCODRAFT_155205 [Baudoinia panamericana UAMH 10762]EMC97947.1 hypothetical protein BAUCODRAFT_155205 [Baudoinia panamericana UAMH 10762]
MEDDFNGNTYLPFTELIRLEKVDERTFRSRAIPFAPGGQLGQRRTYGGHVFMQAAWAASQTIGDGFLLHHISGNFILPGLVNIPFVYKVHIIRDGRSYATRIVNVTQAQEKGICFTCTCSFKRPETSPLEVQERLDIWKQYSTVLDGKHPADFDEIPGMDVPWYWKRRKETGTNDQFPGLEMRKVEMEKYNSQRHPLDRRQLMFYRTLGDLKSDPNLHLCAHLYASDRNSLFIVANHFEVGDIYTQMGSLVHSVTFHGDAKDALFGPSTHTDSPLDDQNGRWFAKEDWGSRMSGGRTMFHSRLFSANGTHIATVLQDGMIRVTKKPTASDEEVQMLEKRAAEWKPRTKL